MAYLPRLAWTCLALPVLADNSLYRHVNDLTRICLDRAKKKTPIFVETIPNSPDPDPGAADAIMRQETAVTVRTALDSLPPKQRMAIVFRYYEELSYKDIASALETTPKAVERLLARARETLRSKFADKDDFDFFKGGV